MSQGVVRGDKEFADRCAETIREYWRAKGYAVKVVVYEELLWEKRTTKPRTHHLIRIVDHRRIQV